MKPTCLTYTTKLASSTKLNIYEYNFQKCGFSRFAGQAIIPLKSKLYYDEKELFINCCSNFYIPAYAG